MFTLAAGDTLFGDADVNSSVTCTIFGMEYLPATKDENYKVLYQGQLTAAAATLYTAPTSTVALIKTITIVNNDVGASHQFQLFRGGSAGSNAITPLTTLAAGGFMVYEDGRGWQGYNAAGQMQNNIYSAILAESNYGMAGMKAETIPRQLCPETNTAMAASGTLNMQAIYLRAGTVVSSITLYSATTAAGTPTNYFFGLYDINRNLLASTANQLTAAWAALSLKTLALTAQYTIPADGLYYIGYFMTATTMPTLKGYTARAAAGLAGQAPVLQGPSTTGLTTALPATAAAITPSTASFWAAVS